MKFLKRFKFDSYLLCGIGALFIWTFVPGIKRLLNESLSMYITAAITNLFGGIILVWFKYKKSGFTPIKQVNKKYWFLCAVPYFIYTLCSVCSSGFSSSRQGAMIVNLFTALWPLSGLVCSVLILKKKTTKFFPLACLLSVVGVGFACISGFDGSISELLKHDGLAIAFAIYEALSWGVYSGYYSKYVKDMKDDYQPVIQLLFGIVMVIVVIVKGETIKEFNFSVLLAILFQLILVSVLGNYLWNYSMMGPSAFNVVILSNLSPVFSSIFSSLILGLDLNWQLILGACVVVASTLLTKKCIINK